jgi:cation transport ATPase
MDVPISIGVTLATALSFYETVTHGAEAWFDGTLMLLFFLLAGRALDAMMRDRARAGVMRCCARLRPVRWWWPPMAPRPGWRRRTWRPAW